MSLSGVMTALAEYVGDELVNTCDRPAPDRVLRYFGTAGLPQDCCTEKGVLSVSWSRGAASKNFPQESREVPCPGKPLYTLEVRYDVCWPVPNVDANGIDIIDDAWDELAAVLSDVADCVARALLRISCRDQQTEKGAALIEALHCNDFVYRDVVPQIGGGCARLTWTVLSGVRLESAAS